MPNIAAWHPQIIHFVVALAFVGVGARIASLLPLGEKFKFANAMATTLIIIAAIAGVLAVQSGTDAHAPVERVPGARAAVQEHEDAGTLARTLLLGLAVLEIAALALSKRGKIGTGLRVAAALGGLATCAAVFETAEHGGILVYNYAGGIGLRSGDTTDVTRLLVAGLYHDAMRARAAHDTATAGRLMAELRRQMPADSGVRFLVIESMIKDLGKSREALDSLRALQPASDNRRMIFQKAMLTADAYVALGHPDSARITLEALKAATPAGPGQDRIQQAIDRLPRAD